MTTLASWAAIDSRGIASLYLVSDSRFTYAISGKVQSDEGQKIYACQTQPNLFGYCGWVDFPARALREITEEIDAGKLFLREDTIDVKQEKLLVELKRKLNSVLATTRLPPNLSFKILHAARHGSGLKARFTVWVNQWSFSGGWRIEELDLPVHSDLVDQDGSGAAALIIEHDRWQRSDVAKTSRAVFSAFCDALKKKTDPYSGGPPQLAGLFRTGTAHHFGIVYNGKLYFQGKEATAPGLPKVPEWFNETFERCDPITLKRLPYAQPQPRPWRTSPGSRHLP
jgi:hypothetical protein